MLQLQNMQITDARILRKRPVVMFHMPTCMARSHKCPTSLGCNAIWNMKTAARPVIDLAAHLLLTLGLLTSQMTIPQANQHIPAAPVVLTAIATKKMTLALVANLAITLAHALPSVTGSTHLTKDLAMVRLVHLLEV